MKVSLKKCEACGGYHDPLGFSKIGALDVCTACQIDLEVNVNELMQTIKQLFRKRDKEAT